MSLDWTKIPALNWTEIAALIALVISVINIYFNWKNSKKTSFINTVTSERVIWIKNVRVNIAKFVGFSYHWAATAGIDAKKKQEILEELDRLRFLIKLQLNPRDEHYAKISELIDEIPDLANPDKKDELKIAIDSLVAECQALLKDEWETVKKESIQGNLS